MSDRPSDRAASGGDEFDRACERAADASRASIDPLNQVVYALQRAKQRLEFEAAELHEAHDYSAEFPASDAEQIGHAISFVRVLGELLMPRAEQTVDVAFDGKDLGRIDTTNTAELQRVAKTLLPHIISDLKSSEPGGAASPQPAPAPVQADASRSWPEDAQHENGNYECECVECGHHFTGHKRRRVCKVCTQPPAPGEAVRQAWRAAITLANNICAQESDRENDADGNVGWIDGTAECAKRIRAYVEPTNDELLQMLQENGATAAIAALAQPLRKSNAALVLLTGEQIKDLAEFAGLRVDPEDDELILESEFAICECPPEGVHNDGEPTDPKSVSHYALIAYCEDCPDEGCVGLGPEIAPQNPGPDTPCA